MMDNRYINAKKIMEDVMQRMVEMGIGVNLATQMMNAMNMSMAQANTPKVGLSAPQMPNQPVTGAMEFYAVVDGSVAGPMNETELDALVKKSKVDAETFVWRKGMPSWVKAQTVPEVNKLLILNA